MRPDSLSGPPKVIGIDLDLNGTACLLSFNQYGGIMPTFMDVETLLAHPDRHGRGRRPSASRFIDPDWFQKIAHWAKDEDAVVAIEEPILMWPRSLASIQRQGYHLGCMITALRHQAIEGRVRTVPPKQWKGYFHMLPPPKKDRDAFTNYDPKMTARKTAYAMLPECAGLFAEHKKLEIPRCEAALIALYGRYTNLWTTG